RMVMECVKQLYQTVDINETINDVLRRVGTFLSADRVYIFGFHDKEMFNRFEWCADGITPQIKNLQHLNIALIDSWMPFFCQHECKIISDLETIKESEPISYEILSNQNIHSLVAAPLEKDGHLNGYFGVDNPPEEKIHNIISLFHTLSFFLMASMRRAEDEQLLAKLSYYDVLTGFYNRNRFIGDTNAMTNLNGPIGVVYLDVNGLKDINDLKGHDYGDRVLISCAKKMEEEFANGSFYRIGGDEFVIICKQFKKEDFLNGIKRLRARFADDNDCRAAIGYQWEESVRDVGAMIIKADAQMYEDKKEFYRLHPSSHRYREWNKE
ncbi:MAG: diguanylate cyclase, partial [Oscillospiraceae bacterium]